MTIQARWSGSSYVIPHYFANNLVLCGVLTAQTPEILDKDHSGNLFIYCSKSAHNDKGYRTVSVVYSSSEYHAKTLDNNMYTNSYRIEKGTNKERRKAIVMATVEFLNQIIRSEKDKG